MWRWKHCVTDGHGEFTLDAIWHYATIDRVANVMRPYLESVTA
jgi:hypothetical protein